MVIYFSLTNEQKYGVDAKWNFTLSAKFIFTL